jgi:hypothetical protein
MTEAVKNQVLASALQLEERGILGDGQTFTQGEREQAQTIHIVGNVCVIGNPTGHLNVATASGPVSQSIDTGTILQAVEAIRSLLSSLPEERRAEMDESLNELKEGAKQPQPDQSRVRSAGRKIRAAAGRLTDKAMEIGIKAIVDHALGP